jgi:hypothetical protein
LKKARERGHDAEHVLGVRLGIRARSRLRVEPQTFLLERDNAITWWFGRSESGVLAYVNPRMGQRGTDDPSGWSMAAAEERVLYPLVLRRRGLNVGQQANPNSSASLRASRRSLLIRRLGLLGIKEGACSSQNPLRHAGAAGRPPTPPRSWRIRPGIFTRAREVQVRAVGQNCAVYRLAGS